MCEHIHTYVCIYTSIHIYVLGNNLSQKDLNLVKQAYHVCADQQISELTALTVELTSGLS